MNLRFGFSISEKKKKKKRRKDDFESVGCLGQYYYFNIAFQSLKLGFLFACFSSLIFFSSVFWAF